MSFSQRRVVDGAPKECGGAEHVVSKVTYLHIWQFAFFAFLNHPKYLKKELSCSSKK